MAINERLIHTAAEAAAAGATNAEQNLILHLDANDVDSYDGNGSVWYDISEHDITIPLSDNADDLEIHLNASDTTSYDPATDTTTWTDISSNTNNATGNSLTNTDHDIDNGGFFTLDGANDYFEISNDTSFASATNWSVEMWINPVSIASDEMLATLYGSSTDQKFDIRFNNSSGNIRFIAATSSGGYDSGQDLSSSTALSTSTWYHLVCVYDNTNDKMFIYIDGDLDATKTSTNDGTYTSITDPILIGKRTDGYHSNIKLGAFRFYSKALSASEVGQNYRHGRDYIYTDLVDDTNLALHFDAADLTSAANTTWTDKVASLALTKSGTVGYDDELGDFIDFAGGGYYGNDTATNTIKDSNGDFAVEFWFKISSASGTNALLGIMQDATNRGFMLYFDGSTMDVYNYKDGTMGGSQFTSQSYSTLGVSTGKWHHIVHVIDASTSIKTYVDGVLKATSTSNAGGAQWTAMDGIRIGDMETLSYGINGFFGQLRIYKGLLTADEVMQNYLFTKNDYPNGANGTISGASWSADYFNFDGSNDVITLNNSKVSSNTVRSYSCWFNRDGNGYLISNTNGSSYGAHLYISSGNLKGWVYSQAQNAYYTLLDGNHSTTAGTWHHAVLTWGEDASDCKLYLDGVLKETESATSGSLLSGAAPNEVRIGRYTSSYFDGKISKVKMYDKVLTQAEVTALYNEGSGN